MEHWPELSKIIEGALRLDQEKVIAYTKHLAQKLREIGEERYAERLEKLVANPRTATLQPSRLSTVERLPIDHDSRLPLGDVYTAETLEPNVVLTPSVQDSVERFCSYYEHAGKLELAGAPVRPTALLFGPPGCGKTATANLIAKRLGLPLIVARLDSLLSSFLGNTAKNLRLLFDYANRQPCVLLLDEFDSIAKLRDDRNELGELKRVVNSLLQNLDAMDQQSVVLAATNHEMLLDPAVWRRFYFKIEIGLPDDETRKQIISMYLPSDGANLSDDDLIALSRLMRDCSPADIRDICQDAIRDAVLSGRPVCAWSVVDAFFRFRGVPDAKLTDSQGRLRWLHDQDSKIFSVTRLALMSGVSKSTVSRILRKEASEIG